MKILMPYKVQNSIPFGSKVVAGGIEKFAQSLCDNIEGIIPVMITKEDRTKRRTKAIIEAAIHKHSPDMAISNDIDYSCSGFFQEFDIPLISIIHEPLCRDIRFLELGPRLNKAIDKGAHVYFVSDNQYTFHSAMSKRISGEELRPIKGTIRPSFWNNDLESLPSLERLYDCATVGRTDVLKNPFFLHNRMKGADRLISMVITSKEEACKSKAQNAYITKNADWKFPRWTVRGAPYIGVMKYLSTAKTFVSTCPAESWGISTMEALSLGMPCVFVTNKTGKHSSQTVAADVSHYTNVPTGIKPKEFQDIIRNLIANTSDSQREDIAFMTREKHSKENFKLQLDKMIALRYDDKQAVTKNRLTF